MSRQRNREAEILEEVSQPETFEMTRQELHDMYDFYKSLFVANEIFKACQDSAFRQHAKACLTAQNAARAFEHVREILGESL